MVQPPQSPTQTQEPIGKLTEGHTSQEKARDINEMRLVIKEASQLRKMIEEHNKKYPEFRVSNHLGNLPENADKNQIHAAVAKTFASYLVQYYRSHGISDDALKNIQVKMSDGSMRSVGLIRADGSIEDNPEKLIGPKRKDGSYDYDGGNPSRFNEKDAKVLDKTDGILTTLTWANPKIKDTRDACFGQLSTEFRRYVDAFKPPASPIITTPPVPDQPKETPHVSRTRELAQHRGAAVTSRVNVDTNQCGPTESAVITPIQIDEAAPVGGAFVFGSGGGAVKLPCPPCPPVLPKIAN